MYTPEHTPKENAEEILSFMPHGWRAVKALQAQCRLFQELPAISREDTEKVEQRMEALTHVIAGMADHLQTIHDVIDNVEGYAEDILGLIPPRPFTSPKKRTKVVNE